MEKAGVKLTAPVKNSLFSIREHTTSGKASLFNHLADFSSKAFPEFSLSLIPKPYSPNDHKNPQTSKLSSNITDFHYRDGNPLRQGRREPRATYFPYFPLLLS